MRTHTHLPYLGVIAYGLTACTLPHQHINPPLSFRTTHTHPPLHHHSTCPGTPPHMRSNRAWRCCYLTSNAIAAMIRCLMGHVRLSSLVSSVLIVVVDGGWWVMHDDSGWCVVASFVTAGCKYTSRSHTH